MRAAVTILLNEFRRVGRDRLSLFFILVLPFVIIVALGAFIPPSEVDLVLAVVDEDQSSASSEVADELGALDNVEVRTDLDRREAERDLRIQQLSAVVVLPEGFGDSLDDGTGRIEVVVDRTRSSSSLVQSTLDDLLAQRATQLTVARELTAAGANDPVAIADSAIADLPPSEVSVTIQGSTDGASNFAFVSAGQMILFMFVNCLAAGAGYIELRRLGILGRIAAGPTSAGDVLTGIGAARFLIATGLAAMIAVLAAVLYDVDWGSWAVVATVVLLFALVSAGASSLIGAVFDNPDAATSVGIPLGLGMAALGGCMFPLFLAPPAMQVAAKVFTPHAWAVDALLASSYDGAGLADVWTNLAVLALWASVLIGLGRVLARRKLAP